jgi:xanthine/uracil permease
LDDHADALLRRRFGVGVASWAYWSPRKQVLMSVAVAGAVALVLVVALVASGQSGRTPVVIGPVVGTVVGTALGRRIRDARKRR